MADADSPGSDRGELKKLLKLAAHKPVHMAFALGQDGKAIVKLDKMKPPRALEKGLKEDAEGSKNHRFGTVIIDPLEPKIAKFIVNKNVSGFARKLVIALKGTGFTKVKLVTEDGSPLEDAAGDDEDEDEVDEDDTEIEAGAGPDGAAADGMEPMSPQDPPAETAASPGLSTKDGSGSPETPAAPADAGTLMKDLTALVKQMLAVIAKDPAQKAGLAELATDAQASLKRGDLDQAGAGIDILREAIASASGQDAPDLPASPDAGANGAPDPAQTQRLNKSCAIWSATRGKIEADLNKLNKAILDAAKNDDDAADLEKLLNLVIEPVLTNLDDSLSDTLAKASAATDGDERQKLMQDAQSTLESYQRFVQGNKILSHLDDNPFVAVSIVKTITSTLTALSAAVR